MQTTVGQTVSEFNVLRLSIADNDVQIAAIIFIINNSIDKKDKALCRNTASLITCRKDKTPEGQGTEGIETQIKMIRQSI